MPSQIEIDGLQKENLKFSIELKDKKKIIELLEDQIISLNKEITKLLSIIKKKNETKDLSYNLNKGYSPNMEEYYQENQINYVV